jgi:hypothetical protein
MLDAPTVIAAAAPAPSNTSRRVIFILPAQIKLTAPFYRVNQSMRHNSFDDVSSGRLSSSRYAKRYRAF